MAASAEKLRDLGWKPGQDASNGKLDLTSARRCADDLNNAVPVLDDVTGANADRKHDLARYCEKSLDHMNDAWDHLSDYQDYLEQNGLMTDERKKEFQNAFKQLHDAEIQVGGCLKAVDPESAYLESSRCKFTSSELPKVEEGNWGNISHRLGIASSDLDHFESGVKGINNELTDDLNHDAAYLKGHPGARLDHDLPDGWSQASSKSASALSFGTEVVAAHVLAGYSADANASAEQQAGKEDAVLGSYVDADKDAKSAADELEMA